MPDTPYVPPKVWTHDAPSGGKFASINAPTAGAREERVLPVGKHPLQLYSLATPNGVKVSIMLEELLAAGHSGAEYHAWLINIGDGDQFGSGFVEINPNSKIPALADHSVAGEPLRVFESGSILVYLAEKFGAFPRRRLRPFLCLRAGEVRVPDQPLRHGGQAPARRARPPAGGEPLRGR